MQSKMSLQSSWFLLVNPAADSGRALRDYPLISRLLRQAGVECEPAFAEYKSHAVELTVKAINDGYRKIIIVGGDGTLHEVVNGLFIQQVVEPSEVLLALIAVKRSSDWVRSYGAPVSYQQSVEAIVAGYSMFQDVGVVSYEESHYKQQRYMANVASVGLEPLWRSVSLTYAIRVQTTLGGLHGIWLEHSLGINPLVLRCGSMASWSTITY